MKLSIALATYNGARYLQEQLDSFSAQTRAPDELVVCDDASTDATMDILNGFAQVAEFPVRIFRNTANLGYTANFEQALSLCTGDLVFLSDQDDVWFKGKLEILEKEFTAYPRAMVVVNDQEIADDALRPTGLTIFSNNRSLGLDESAISSGCCTAVRASFMNVLFPFPKGLIAYDGWIHRLAMGLGARRVLPDVLQYYRRHQSNASQPIAASLERPNRFAHWRAYGLKDATAGWSREAALSRYIAKTLLNTSAVLRDLGLAERAAALCTYEANRAVAIENRIRLMTLSGIARVSGVFNSLITGRYSYFSGWKSAVKDLVR